MQPEMQEAFRMFRSAYANWRTALARRRDALTQNLSQEELADQAYTFREMKKIAEELVKAVEECHGKAQRLACLKWLTESATGEPIRTEFCTATPDVKQLVVIPSRKKNWAGYARLMNWLGVPEALYSGAKEEGKSPVVDLHYRGLLDHVQDMQAAGEPLPEGIIDQNNAQLFLLVIRGKKGVDEN